MITSYDKTKEDVLRCYDEFLKIIGQADLSQEDRSLIALERQAEKIKADKFCLMVAGQAKSGKSTFINAYLGTEILPTGVWQCTSSLIEICYGEELILNATFADGREQKYTGEQVIKDFLNEYAALKDEYRAIPIPTINNEIILKYQEKTISEGIIRDLLKEVEKENIERLPKEEYERRIREYIKEKQPQWENIVVKIDIQYPFEDKNMRGVRVIDSPGVNAVGKVGDITASCIKSADAIMFVRPIMGADIGDIAFKNFLESNSEDRNGNTLFLVLTCAAGNAPANNQLALDGFMNVFGTKENASRQGIVKEQIIPVDSKAECYYNLFQKLSTEEIRARINSLKAKGEAEPFLKAAWSDAEGDKDAFLRELKRYSNFDVIEQSLNRFGHKAQFLALSEFLERMLKVYEKIAAGLVDSIVNYECMAEDPTKLAAKIGETKAALEDLTKKMNETAKEISEKYAGSDTNGIIAKKADDVMKAYLDEVEKIEGTSESSFAAFDKLTLQQVDRFKNFEEELQKKIVSECNETMGELSDKSAIKFVTLEPDFSEEVIDEIKESMRAEATVETTVTKKVGACAGKIKETLPVFLQDKFYNIVKRRLIEEVGGIKEDAVNELISFVKHTVNAYKAELERNAKAKEDELTQIENEKKTADEIATILTGLNKLLALVEPQKNIVREIKGGIDGNVR